MGQPTHIQDDYRIRNGRNSNHGTKGLHCVDLSKAGDKLLETPVIVFAFGLKAMASFEQLNLMNTANVSER